MNILNYTNNLILEVSGTKVPEIILKHNSEKEQKRANLIRGLYEKYNLPVELNKPNKIIVTDERKPSHSHPIITMNCREGKHIELDILQKLIHEHFHWLNDLEDCMEELKSIYNDNGEHSFYLHIIVGWNTMNYLNEILFTPDVIKIYRETFQPYPKTEKLVEKDFNKIKTILEKHDLVYRG